MPVSVVQMLEYCLSQSKTKHNPINPKIVITYPGAPLSGLIVRRTPNTKWRVFSTETLEKISKLSWQIYPHAVRITFNKQHSLHHTKNLKAKCTALLLTRNNCSDFMMKAIINSY